MDDVIVFFKTPEEHIARLEAVFKKIEQEQAFQQLKEVCIKTPVLAYADYKKPFRLNTDASELGLGSVLYQ